MRHLFHRGVTFLGALLIGLVAFAGPAVAAPSSTNAGAANLCNFSPNQSTTIGLIHTPDGSYVHGDYDTAVGGIGNAVRCSQQLGWPHAGGFYIPPRTAMLVYDSLGRLIARIPTTDHVSKAWFFPDNAAAKYNLQPCAFFNNDQCNIT